jgi:hypothetical protein
VWEYSQKFGTLQRDGELVARGYSGNGDGKNNPLKQNVKGVGPIPRGNYIVTLKPIDTVSHGPCVLVLTPAPSNEMFGRSAFLIHGDSKSAPGSASKGCIIVGRAARERIAASGDSLLRVHV